MPVTLHFLNVGHGDCTIIEHASGRITVIDINNAQDLDEQTAAELEEAYSARSLDITLGKLLGKSEGAVLKTAGYDVELTNPIEFLKKAYPNRAIWRYVQTHPDLDHMRGLAALSSDFVIHNFWDTANNKVITEFKNDADKEDWSAYQSLRNGRPGTRILKLTRDQSGIFYNEEPEGVAGGDSIRILAPSPTLTTKANETDCSNLHSYVLAVEHAGTRVVLGGDADVEAWESIAAHYGAAALDCTVLKASHHGRESGYSEYAVNLMSPACVVVSVGKKPDTDAHNLYKTHCKKVWSTRWLGNMRFVIDDTGGVTYTLQYGDRL